MKRLLERWLRKVAGDDLARDIVGDAAESGGGIAQLAGIALSLTARNLAARPRVSMTGAAIEARQALRSLLRTPASTAVVVLTLAAGLGINTAIFSVVYGVLFRPLPFAEPGRIVTIEGRKRDASAPPSMYSSSLADFEDFERGNRTFESMGLASYWTFNLTGAGEAQRVLGMAVTERFFETLRVRPIMGRSLTADDNRPDGKPATVIGYGLWQRLLGGRADAVGQTLSLNGVPTEVVGVMPASFRFPASDVELWTALRNEMDGTPRNVRFLLAVGRLRKGATIEQATDDLNAIAAALETQFPETNKGWRVQVVPAARALTSIVRDQLMLLFAAVIIVLLVAAVNVAGLLASRRAAREREWALRAALGAGWLRLARLSLFETLWQGAAGLALGLALAGPSVALLKAAAPPSLPRVDDVALSWPVIAASTAAMLAIVLACSIAPVWTRRKSALGRAVGDARSTSARSRRIFGRSGLVVIQVALAFVLLVGTGLLARSFSRVAAVEPGFNAERLLTMRLFMGPPRYRSIESQVAFADRALAALRALPGVTAATLVSQPPFDQQSSGTSLPTAVEGRTYGAGELPNAVYRVAAPGYFAAMGQPILAGRDLSESDTAAAQPVVVINASMAARFFPGESPIGRRVRWPQTPNSVSMTIVGVAGDVATNGLEKREPPAMYGPYAQRTVPYVRWLALIARTEGAPGDRAADVRAAIRSVDSEQPLFAVETMDAIVGRSLAERRFALLLMLSFAGLTLFVAMLGLYGALAQAVHERRREIAVRVAIGASAAAVFREIALRGLALAALGTIIGAATARASSGAIQNLLFGVSAGDPWTYVVIAGVLMLTAAVAVALPARRASRVDPIQALRLD